MKELFKYLLRVSCGITLAAAITIVTVASVGCQKETKKKPSPEEINKARQQQIQMSQREMQDQTKRRP